MTTFDNEFDVQKDLVRAQGDGFQLQDQTPLVNMGNMASPQLLTVLMGGAQSATNHLNTNVFQYDEKNYVPQVFTGKSFTEKGKDLAKQKAKTRFFEVGSKGVRFNVSVEDYDGKRKAGTNEFLTEADVLADQIAKANQAAMLDMELDFASILTTGKNRVAGGPFTSYDFHTDILGSARPTALTVDYASASVNPAEVIRGEAQAMQNKLLSYGLNANGFIVICGDKYFSAAYEYEQMTTIARELRTTVDLVSQALPTIDHKGYRFPNFDSPTSGVTYVNYSANILAGTKMIGDKEAYLIPLISGAPLVEKVFAPAKVRGYVNQPAQEMYSWFAVDDFKGVTGWYERNCLTVLPRPDLIRNLDIA